MGDTPNQGPGGNSAKVVTEINKPGEKTGSVVTESNK